MSMTGIIMIVGASEHHVAGLQCITTRRVADPSPDGHDSATQAERRNLSSEHVDLSTHRIGICLASAMQPVEIRRLDNVFVEKCNLSDAESRE